MNWFTLLALGVFWMWGYYRGFKQGQGIKRVRDGD